MDRAALRRRLLLPALLSAVLLGLVALSGVGLFVKRTRDGTAARLDTHLAELRERGEPTDLEQLDSDVPDPEDDAGPLLRDAWAWLEENPPPVNSLPSDAFASQLAFDRLEGQSKDDVFEYVSRLAPILGSMHEAVERPGWRPLGDPSLFPDVHVVPHLHRSQLASTLALRCIPEASLPPSGPAASAERLRVIRTAGLVAARWRRPWSEAEHLVQLTLVRSALTQSMDQLAIGRVRARAAADALAPLLAFDSRAAVLASLRAGRVRTLVLVRRFVGDDPGALPVDVDYDGSSVWQNAFARREMIECSARLQSALDVRDPSWTELAVRIHPFGQRMASLRLVEGYGPSLVSVSLYLSRASVAAGTQLSATQSLARLSFAAVASFDESGAWPGSLDDVDVAPEHRIDPFTDQPFVFERLVDGIRISSAGPTDPEIWGARSVERNDPEADGLVWTLRR